MGKIGILTYHYSNNYGGVLQSYALYSYLTSKNLDVEIIDFVPKKYKNHKVLHSTGLKNIFKSNQEDSNLKLIFYRITVKMVFNKRIVKKFNYFREKNMKLSPRVDEENISTLLEKYESIIVGSDQIWGPSERSEKEYFLAFGELFKGKKYSYAADSTIAEVNPKHVDKLRQDLGDFDAISVRNEHTVKFVKNLTGKAVPVVVDPTLLHDFNDPIIDINEIIREKYILVYTLGKEIKGTNKAAIQKIKEKYGDLKVISVIIPTMKFTSCNYADKIFYDLGPTEWVSLIKNASFVYTDSFHGTLFSLKFHKPFLAYYAEKIRSTRFKDLGKRFEIERYIVNSVDDIDKKQSLDYLPDYCKIDKLICTHKKQSVKYLHDIFNIK